MRHVRTSTKLLGPLLLACMVAWAASYIWSFDLNIQFTYDRGFAVQSRSGDLLLVWHSWRAEHHVGLRTVDEPSMFDVVALAGDATWGRYDSIEELDVRWLRVPYWFLAFTVTGLWLVLTLLHYRKLKPKQSSAEQAPS